MVTGTAGPDTELATSALQRFRHQNLMAYAVWSVDAELPLGMAALIFFDCFPVDELTRVRSCRTGSG